MLNNEGEEKTMKEGQQDLFNELSREQAEAENSLEQEEDEQKQAVNETSQEESDA